jgi:hypothetical protein
MLSYRCPSPGGARRRKMTNVNRPRVEDMIQEINEKLKDFSLESGIKTNIRISKEKTHLLNLLFYALSSDESFEKGRFSINVRFVFPLLSRKFLGVGFTLFSYKYIIDHPAIVDDIEGGVIRSPKMFVVVLPIFGLFDNANKEEKFRIYGLLENLGFNVWDNTFYPYFDYSLDEREYLLEE